jgi:hypothetical protein
VRRDQDISFVVDTRHVVRPRSSYDVLQNHKQPDGDIQFVIVAGAVNCGQYLTTQAPGPLHRSNTMQVHNPTRLTQLAEKSHPTFSMVPMRLGCHSIRIVVTVRLLTRCLLHPALFEKEPPAWRVAAAVNHRTLFGRSRGMVMLRDSWPRRLHVEIRTPAFDLRPGCPKQSPEHSQTNPRERCCRTSPSRGNAVVVTHSVSSLPQLTTSDLGSRWGCSAFNSDRLAARLSAEVVLISPLGKRLISRATEVGQVDSSR